jgi:hypothetical protein
MPKLAVGHPTKDGIAATLPKPLFRRLRTRAAKEGKTVSETIAMLCSIGLLDLDECDRFEPEVNPRPDGPAAAAQRLAEVRQYVIPGGNVPSLPSHHLVRSFS